jgi:hypothetical protein
VLFNVEEATRRYYNRPSPVIVGVEHLFLAALRQLLDDHAGGGLFHYAGSHEFHTRLRTEVMRTEERWNPPNPLDFITQEQRDETERAGISGHSLTAIPLSGPPPGWRPPFTGEYQELVARHRRMALERGDSYTTIYEVLADVLTYPQVKRLLEAAGQSAEEIAERVRPYLDRKVAEEEVGPNVRRWQTVAIGLPHGTDFLEPHAQQPTRIFRIGMAQFIAMTLAMDTLTLSHLFLAGITQVLTNGFDDRQPDPDSLLGPLIPAIENDLTGGKPLPPDTIVIDSTGQKVIQGKVSVSMLKVPPEVELFLHRHGEVAAQRGEPNDTFAEVLLDLLTYPEITELLTRLGYSIDEVRARVQR